MKIQTEPFRVEEDEAVDLEKRPTRVEPVYKSKEHYQEILRDHVNEMADLQRILYAADQ